MASRPWGVRCGKIAYPLVLQSGMWRSALALLPLLVACPKATPPAPETLDERMLQHFGYGTEAHDAIILGDLGKAQAAGAALAKLEPLEGTPEAWKPDLAAVRAAAAALAGAPTLAEAARRMTALGTACAACHIRTGNGPKAPAADYKTESAIPTEPMQRHEWATLWVWYGLISADNAAYDAGLATLAEPPTWDPRTDNTTFAGLQMRVKDLAASPATTAADRAALYGELLATCSACHDRYKREK